MGKKILISSLFPPKFFDQGPFSKASLMMRKAAAVAARRQVVSADHIAVTDEDVGMARRRRTMPPAVPVFAVPSTSVAPVEGDAAIAAGVFT